MTWPEWKMGYFEKKRKEREEYIAQRKVLNFLLPRILPPKIAAPSMKRKCSAICKLSIWYVFSFQASKKCLPSLYAGKMGAYWAVRLPIPVPPQAISFWHIISIYSPICSFIRVYNKGYLYSRDSAVSLKSLTIAHRYRGIPFASYAQQRTTSNQFIPYIALKGRYCTMCKSCAILLAV